MRFKGKTILVTGATSGIGYGATQRLLEWGAHVIAIGRNHSRLNELTKIASAGVITPLNFDLLDFDSYRTMVASLDSLDGVVHSAGVSENNPMRFFSLEKYRRVIDINLTAPTLLTAELLRAGKVNSGGSIVFVASISGTTIGIRGSAAYGASKSGLLGVSRVVALEVGHKNIRSNCISPGMVETEMIENAHELSGGDRAVDRARYPLGGRYGRVEEIADSILYLLSSDSSFMTGQNLILDGGYSAL